MVKMLQWTLHTKFMVTNKYRRRWKLLLVIRQMRNKTPKDTLHLLKWLKLLSAGKVVGTLAHCWWECGLVALESNLIASHEVQPIPNPYLMVSLWLFSLEK